MILRHVTINLDVPRDLSTGCAAGFREEKNCPHRITHGTLNKDRGTIDPVTGAAGAALTSRGKVPGLSDNFRRAVRGAIAETRRQWEDFRQALVPPTARNAEP